MKYLTKDGQSFDDIDAAMKHESNLAVTEKIALEQEKEKKRREFKKKLLEEKKEDYKNVMQELSSIQKSISEYNKKYNDRISVVVHMMFNENIPDSLVTETMDKESKKDNKNNRSEYRVRNNIALESLISDLLKM